MNVVEQLCGQKGLSLDYLFRRAYQVRWEEIQSPGAKEAQRALELYRAKQVIMPAVETYCRRELDGR